MKRLFVFAIVVFLLLAGLVSVQAQGREWIDVTACQTGSGAFVVWATNWTAQDQALLWFDCVGDDCSYPPTSLGMVLRGETAQFTYSEASAALIVVHSAVIPVIAGQVEVSENTSPCMPRDMGGGAFSTSPGRSNRAQ